MRILVNNEEVSMVPPKELAGTLFPFLFAEAKYMSFDALKCNVEKLIETLGEYTELFGTETSGKGVKGTVTRMKKTLIQWKQRLDRTDDRNRLIDWVYSTILGLEGLSLLTGYGFANKYGDRMGGNPEIHSTR